MAENEILQAVNNLPPKQIGQLRFLVETMYDLQKVRIATSNRIKKYCEIADTTEAELKEYHSHADESYAENEKWMEKESFAIIKDHPIYDRWLSKVKGIGPRLSGGLLAWIDLYRATHVSSVWKYCGMAVVTTRYHCGACKEEFPVADVPEFENGCPKCKGQLFRIGEADRRRRGEKLGYNPGAKVLVWKIGNQFVKQGDSYRKLYDHFRKEVEQRPCHKVHLDEKTKKPIPCFDAHKHAKALRLTIKIFLSHYYIVGRKIFGLPISDPFPFGVLGHDRASYIEPLIDRE